MPEMTGVPDSVRGRAPGDRVESGPDSGMLAASCVHRRSGDIRMRRPRFRITVRATLGLVAACALAMLLYGELKDGLPPRFIVRTLPARIACLRSGMPRAEARDILGIGRPWYRGGLGELTTSSVGAGVFTSEICPIRPTKFAFELNPSGGAIHLNHASDELHSAKFVDGSGTVSEMPGRLKP